MFRLPVCCRVLADQSLSSISWIRNNAINEELTQNNAHFVSFYLVVQTLNYFLSSVKPNRRQYVSAALCFELCILIKKAKKH